MAVGCCQFGGDRRFLFGGDEDGGDDDNEDYDDADEGDEKCWYDGSGCYESIEGEALDAEDPDACRELGDGNICDDAYSDCTAVYALILVISLICVCWPLIIFAVACCACIQPRQRAGQKPTPTAWASCIGVFVLVCVIGNVFLPGAWLWGAFFMIIPFCCYGSESCYTAASTRPAAAMPPQHAQLPVATARAVVATPVITDSNPLHHGMPPQQVFQPQDAIAMQPPQQDFQPQGAIAMQPPQGHVVQAQVVMAVPVVMPAAPPLAAVYRPATVEAVTDQV
jgi:hypothetical protein